jgi:nuclear GTP-binding protein
MIERGVESAGGSILGIHRGTLPLMMLLKKYSLGTSSTGASSTKALSIGIIGYPNSGKSSVINALLASVNKKTRAKTGNAAGVTTMHQEIALDKKLTLIDSPGVVMAAGIGGVEEQASLVLRKAVNVASIEDVVGVVEAVVKRMCKEQVSMQFRVGLFDTVDEFLGVLGKMKGKFKRGGVVDKEAAARFALHAWADGKMKYFTMPEVAVREGTAKLVQNAPGAGGLDLDELFREADEAFKNEQGCTAGFMKVDA